MHSDSTEKEKERKNKFQGALRAPRRGGDSRVEGRWGTGMGWVRASGAWAHSLKQWAADTSHRAPMTAAPQKCSLFSRRLTCQGNSPGDASTPPTILPAVLQPGCKPQSARQITNQDPQGGRALAMLLVRPPLSVSSPQLPRLATHSGPHTWLCCAEWAREHSQRLAGPEEGARPETRPDGRLTTVGLVGAVGAVRCVVALRVHFGDTLAVVTGEGAPWTVA